MKEKSYGHSRSQSSMPLLPYAEMTPPSTPFISTFRARGSPHAFIHKRKTAFVLCAFVSVVSLGVLASWAVSSGSSASYVAPQHAESAVQDVVDLPSNTSAPLPLPEVHEDDVSIEQDYSPYVLGPPTQSFRDNLRNDTKYITSWLSAGWSTLHCTPSAPLY